MRQKMGVAVVAAGMVLMAAAPVMAQDGDVRQETWFEAFFMPEDWVGLVIVWGLIAASFASLGYALKLMLTIRRGALVPDKTADDIEALLAEKRYREAIEYAEGDRSYLGKLMSSALNEAGAGFPAMERAVEEAGDAETGRMLRPIEYLNIVGNIAPMMGLFGTVYGMIRAFQELVAAGGKPDPAQLAAGISTALVTTFWGLIVAMPALAFYALIRNKIDALTSEGVLVAEELIRPFKPGRKTKAAGASAAARPARPEPSE